MRWIFIILIFPWNILRAQVADDFSDGDFTGNPQWIGITENYLIDAASGMLRLNAPYEDGVCWLFTQSTAMEDAVWQFRVKMDFNPSSANYARVYLASESADYSNNGYSFYLVLGTAEDNICLWEQKGSVTRKLIGGQAGRLSLNNVDVRLRVTRKKGGLLILECNMGDGWIEEGRFTGSQGMKSSWFGWSCHYTSSRNKLFYFDDIEITGDPYKDTIPPEINDFEVKNKYGFLLHFSKPISKLQLNPENFSVGPGNHTLEIVKVDGDDYALELLCRQGIPASTDGVLKITGLSDIDNNVMPNVEYPYFYEPTIITSTGVWDLKTLNLCFNRALNSESYSTENFQWVGNGPQISGVTDMGQNCMSLSFGDDFPNGETIQLLINNLVTTNGDTIDAGPYPIFYYLTKRNDIVITEIMSDPTPVVLLSDSEYIEIYNRGEVPIELDGYKLSVGSRNATLGAYLLYPDDYLLLVPSTHSSQWALVTSRLDIENWPLLPNDGSDIILRDRLGRVITSLRFNINMGAPGFKKEGGWSLEVKDPDNLSGDLGNWDYSFHESGGTPGLPNTLDANFPDIKSPEIKGVYIKSYSCVVVEFSEPMAFMDGIGEGEVVVEPAIIELSSYIQEEVFLMESEICFMGDLPQDKKFVLVFNSQPVDLAGNPLLGEPFFSFGSPVKPMAGDIVINELLFDPPTEGSDYIEFYNRSEHLVDLSEVYVARANTEGIPEKLVRLSPNKRVFFPKSYLVYTPDADWMLASYKVEDERSVRSLSDLPNFPSDEGIVYVTDVSGLILDQFNYNDDMQFALLASTKGVALERISSNSPTQESSNWHSASATSGYGTPGMENSQANMFEMAPADDFIRIEPEVFYPNQDGVDDLLFIRYSFKEVGNSCTVTIFNREGRPIRHLINNQLSDLDGFYTWDGLNDKGSRCTSGIYIIWARSFTVNGTVHETRKVAVLGSGRP